MTDSNKGGILFILNPKSGNGKALKTKKLIKKYCDQRKIKYVCIETKEAGDASNLSRKGLECGYNAIVAVGGDGTVNEVGKELIEKEIPLGIVPTGSGNGLARHLGIPISQRRSIKRILNGKRMLIDTGTLDGHVFLNTAGIGFDASVSRAFADTKGRGLLNYIKIVFKLGLKVKSINLTLIHEGVTKKIECIMLTMANSSQFGNNARIAPKADITDGKMDVCVLDHIGVFKAIMFVFRIMTGTARKNNFFNIFQSQSIKIEGYNGWGHVDGEPIQINNSFQVDMKPKSLYIIC